VGAQVAEAMGKTCEEYELNLDVDASTWDSTVV